MTDGSDNIQACIGALETALEKMVVQMNGLVGKSWQDIADANDVISDTLSDLRAAHNRALDRELDVPSDRVRSQMRESKYR